MTTATMATLTILTQAKLENTDLILVVGLGLLLLVLAGSWIARRKPGGGGAPPGGEGTPEERQQRRKEFDAMHRDLGKAMTEIETLARRLGDDLEAKTARIEALMKEADDRIATLQRLQSGANDATDETPSPPAAAIMNRPTSDPDPEPASENDAPDPLSREVYKLADAGHTSMEIARKLNEQIGKIELILALRRA